MTAALIQRGHEMLSVGDIPPRGGCSNGRPMTAAGWYDGTRANL